jgi:hypothetical protein
MNEKEYQNYRYYREYMVLITSYISSFIIYFIPVLLYLFGVKFTNEIAIKLYCGLGIIVLVLCFYFYKSREKQLVKIYSEEKLKKPKKNSELTKVLCGLGGTIGIMYTRQYGGGPWMIVGAIYVSTLCLKSMIIRYWDYKLLDFMENEIHSYVPNTNRTLKK